MITIPISNIPNQSLSIALDGNNYTIRLHACSDVLAVGVGIMAVDIARNTTAIVTGTRAVHGFPLIPYRYLEDGNFIITTNNDEYPNWRLFGINQFLVYASMTEIEEIRNALN